MFGESRDWNGGYFRRHRAIGSTAESAVEGKPLRALIFDSYFDTYRGVVVVFRVFDGEVNVGDKIELMNTGAKYDVLELA